MINMVYHFYVSRRQKEKRMTPPNTMGSDVSESLVYNAAYDQNLGHSLVHKYEDMPGGGGGARHLEDTGRHLEHGVSHLGHEMANKFEGHDMGQNLGHNLGHNLVHKFEDGSRHIEQNLEPSYSEAQSPGN